jgi:hypothetical protein
MRSVDVDDLLNISAASLARSSLSQLLQGAHDGRPARLQVLRCGSIASVRPTLTASGLLPTVDITHRDHHFRKVPCMDGARGARGI